MRFVICLYLVSCNLYLEGMLPKQYRLHRSDFNLIYKKGRRIRGNSFDLIVLPAENKKEPSKIGIVITKKTVKKAVDRNKLKRQIRSVLVKDIIPSLPNGFRIIILVYLEKKFEEIQKELASLLDNLKS